MVRCNGHGMTCVFPGASVCNGDLNKWYVARGIDMTCMFPDASAFTVISAVCATVTDMMRMCCDALAFNGNLSKWYVAMSLT